MAKKKKREAVTLGINGKEISQDGLQKLLGGNRPFEIKEAKVKDDFCNYNYYVKEGVGAGDTHKVTGTGIVDRDMHLAFAKLNVHLAVIDDVFKHSNIEIGDIDNFHGHDLTVLYSVTGFKFSGSEDNETVVLIGTKYVTSAVGRIEIESPKISLDSGSGYKFYNELKEAADNAKEEVALYALGKCTQPEVEEAIEDLPKIDFDNNVNEEEFSTSVAE
jgi:hypothetical protein